MFKLSEWHSGIIDDHPYAVEVVKICNQLIEGIRKVENYKIVEVGCGIGDIIASISCSNRNKIGLDIDKKIIKAAKIIHPFVSFYIGSFNNICNQKIAILVAVNFLHVINDMEVLFCFKNLVRKNDIKYIIVDKVQKKAYKFEHDYDAIMRECGYSLYKKSKRFCASQNSSRWILTYRKMEGLHDK